MKTATTLFVSLLIIGLTACGGKEKSNASDSNANQSTPGGGGGTSLDVIVEFKYYRGGWFTAPGSATFSHDLTIDFLKYENGAYKMTAVNPDPLCFYAAGSIDVNKVNELISHYSKLKLLVSDGPIMADGGVEFIQVKTQAGVTRKFHLMHGEEEKGEQYAINPEDIRAFLRGLISSLPAGCS